jgi:hypothetical protein
MSAVAADNITTTTVTRSRAAPMVRGYTICASTIAAAGAAGIACAGKAPRTVGASPVIAG